jgi:hypothetical protein
MKIVKPKIYALVLTLLLALSLSACGYNNAAPSPSPEQWGNDPTPSDVDAAPALDIDALWSNLDGYWIIAPLLR